MTTTIDARLVNAIKEVESAGNMLAVGDNGKARGGWQLWRCAWDDVNLWRRAHKLPVYSYGDATNESVAHEYAEQFLRICAGRFQHATGREANYKELYAVWNLGFVKFRQLGFDLEKVPLATKQALLKLQRLVEGGK